MSNLLHYKRVAIHWANGGSSLFEVGEENVLSIVEAGEVIVVTYNDGSGSTIYLDGVDQVDWVGAKENA